MKSIQKILATTAIALASTWGAEPDTTFKIHMQFDIQSMKNFDKAWDENTVNDIWGRVRFRAQYNTPSYQSDLYLFYYPEGFGYSTVGLVRQDDSLDFNDFKTQNITKTLVYRANISSKDKPVNFTLGRFGVGSREGHHFGSYLEEFKIAPGFMVSDKTINGLELFTGIKGLYTAGLAFETADANLNKGSVRFEAKLFPGTKQGIYAKAGWRSNAFDVMQADVTPNHTIAGGIGFAVNSDLNLYTEAAAVKLNNDALKKFPITAGLKMKIPGILNTLVVEGEFEKDREIPLIPAIYLDRLIDEWLNIQVGFANTGSTDKFMDNNQITLRVSGMMNPKMPSLLK